MPPNAFSPNAFSPRPAPMPPNEYATRAHLPVLQRELGLVHATSHRRAPAHRRALRAPASAYLPTSARAPRLTAPPPHSRAGGDHGTGKM
jgi:hypothetical protein